MKGTDLPLSGLQGAYARQTLGASDG